MAKVTIEATREDAARFEEALRDDPGMPGAGLLAVIADAIREQTPEPKRWAVTLAPGTYDQQAIGPWIVADADRRFMYLERHTANSVAAALNEMCP